MKRHNVPGRIVYIPSIDPLDKSHQFIEAVESKRFPGKVSIAFCEGTEGPTIVHQAIELNALREAIASIELDITAGDPYLRFTEENEEEIVVEHI